jgi:acyl-CoA synthetase (NDP forming)
LVFRFRSLLAGEIPVPRAILGHKVPLAHKVPKAYKVLPAAKVPQVLKDHRVRRVRLAIKAIRVTRAMPRRPMSEPSKPMDQ